MVEGQEKQPPAVGPYYVSSDALWPSQADASVLVFGSLQCSQGYTSCEAAISQSLCINQEDLVGCVSWQ